MAMRQSLTFSVLGVGDGTSTTFSFDLTRYIDRSSVNPQTPAALARAYGPAVTTNQTPGWGSTITSATLSGKTVTLTFDIPVPAGQEGIFYAELLF